MDPTPAPSSDPTDGKEPRLREMNISDILYRILGAAIAIAGLIGFAISIFALLLEKPNQRPNWSVISIPFEIAVMISSFFCWLIGFHIATAKKTHGNKTARFRIIGPTLAAMCLVFVLVAAILGVGSLPLPDERGSLFAIATVALLAIGVLVHRGKF